MFTKTYQRPFNYLGWLAMSGAILLALLFTNQIAHASEANWTGQIDSMPSGTFEGNWVVGGRSFVADSSTDFRQDKGDFALNVCVEVEYIGSSSPFQATKIASKSEDDCTQSGTPSPSPETGTPETSTPQSTPVPTGDEKEVYGRLESRPSPGLIGDWVVGGIIYNASSGTEFKQEDGPLTVGACVKIHYSGSSAPFTAREIESETASHCNGGSSTPGSTSTSTATPDGEREIYGRINSLPASRTGDWVVNGTTYTAAANTEFDEERGSFAIGVCVKVHFSGSNAPFAAREIESERSSRCGSGSATAESTPGSTATSTPTESESELYGILEGFPADLTGTWNIAGMSFVADSDTEFKERNGSFTVGMTVKVHFSTDANGINHAREIETEFANDDNGHDDDGNGSFEGSEGHAYGLIDSFPAALQGDWTIGGLTYQTNQATRFEQHDGSFAKGTRVKVEYYVDGAGKRVLQKVETTDDTGSTSDSSHSKLVGFVNKMPETGYVGTWVINDIDFEATSASQFKENNGLLGIGAYVTVEYSVVDGKNQIHEIEVHVPPGAGTNITFGKIDDKGGTLNAASLQANTWVINGVSYSITPATDLNDSQGALSIGQPVQINSYTAGDGSQVATQVKAVTEIHQVFLPLTMR